MSATFRKWSRDVDVKDQSGFNALSHATIRLVDKPYYDSEQLIQLLLDYGSEVDSMARWSYSCLSWIGLGKYVEFALVLFEGGANIKFNSNDINSVLLLAVHMGHCKLVTLAISQGADVNHSKYPLLLRAYECDDVEIVKILCLNGADVNARNIFNGRDQTAFLIAIERRRFDVAEILLFYGADVNAKDKSGKTAFDYAPIELKKLLLCVKLKGIWEMETPVFNSYYQWLPGEVSVDLLELVKGPLNKKSCK